MPTFYGAIDLVKNEIRNVVFQNLGAAPSSPTKGQMYFNSADNTMYWYDGGQWIAAKGGAGAVPADTVTTQAVGDAAVPGASALYSRGDHKHAREGFGAVTAETAFGGASSNGSAATVARSDHGHGNPTHVAADHSTIPISSLAMASAPGINMNNQPISNLALVPNNVGDATSKQYVDNLVAGLSWKDSVRVATTANITLSGTQTIDGVSVVANDRVLVKNQTTASGNGLYLCQAGAWTRTTDADGTAEIPGMAVYVEEGTTQNGTAWTLTTDPPITLGVTNLAFAQFGGGTTYNGGAGLTLTGATFDVVAADTTITVNPDSIQVNTAQIATVASVNAKADSARTLTAGAGLTGGGDLSANRTFDVGQGPGITVAADTVAVDTSFVAQKLIPTPTKTTAYTAVVGDEVMCNMSSGAFTVTLPPAPANNSQIGVRIVGPAATPNAVTVVRSGADFINGLTGGWLLLGVNRWVIFQYDTATTNWWSYDGFAPAYLPLNYLAAAVGPISMGNQRITSVADPGSAQDVQTLNGGDLRYPQRSVLTTKGDIYVATGAGIITRQAVGADGTTIVADSSQPNGLRWGSAGVAKFAAALTGTASPETITHNLNTRDVHVAVYNGSTPYTAVEVDWDAATVNTVTVRYNPNLGAGYRVVVMG